MKFGRQVLLLTLLALLLLGQADAGPPGGPGGGMMGGPPPGMSGPPPGMSGPPPGMSGPPPGTADTVSSGVFGPPMEGATANTGQVINLLNSYLKNHPNLKAGNLTVKGNYWEAEILDGQGNLVNKLHIDPRNGYFYYQK